MLAGMMFVDARRRPPGARQMATKTFCWGSASSLCEETPPHLPPHPPKPPAGVGGAPVTLSRKDITICWGPIENARRPSNQFLLCFLAPPTPPTPQLFKLQALLSV